MTDTVYCPICDTPMDDEEWETPHMGEEEAYSAGAWCPLCEFGRCERQPSMEKAKKRLAWFLRDYLPLRGTYHGEW